MNTLLSHSYYFTVVIVLFLFSSSIMIYFLNFDLELN